MLGVRPGASRKEIKQAYRDLARVWHPDRFQGDAALKSKAEIKIKEINEAYERALRWQEAPAAPSRDARMTAASRPSRSFLKDFLLVASLLALIFGALYAYFLFKENSGRLRVGGVTFREWEWDHFFKPGSTKDEVLAVQGAPDRAAGDLWYYGDDTVMFSQGRVFRFSNERGGLRVRVLPENPLPLPPERFTLGSSRDEVLAVQGTPSRMEGDVWYYGKDSVMFSAGRVFKIHNPSGALKVVGSSREAAVS